MIGDILLPHVAAEEAFGDLPGTVLFAEEEEVIARAVDKRRREFTTARACARAALAKLGVPRCRSCPDSAARRSGRPAW